MKTLSLIINGKSIAKIAVLLLLIFLADVQVVEVARANPFPPFFHKVDPIPGAISPRITISSPQNNTVSSSNSITVNFNVSKPQPPKWNSSIIEIRYTLDGRSNLLYYVGYEKTPSGIPGITQYNTTFTLSYLPIGNHNLTIIAEGVVANYKTQELFYLNSYSTVLFATGTQPLQPSPPSATNPSASSNPVLSSNSVPYMVFIVAVLSVLGLFAILVTVVIYKYRKTKATG